MCIDGCLWKSLTAKIIFTTPYTTVTTFKSWVHFLSPRCALWEPPQERLSYLTHKTLAIFWHITLLSVFYGMRIRAFYYSPWIQWPLSFSILWLSYLSVSPSAYKLSYANTYTYTNEQTYSRKTMLFKNRKENIHPLRQKLRCTDKNPHNDTFTRKG